MSFEFFASIPKSSTLDVHIISNALVLHGGCALNRIENNECFLSWTDQVQDVGNGSAVRIWIDFEGIKLSVNGSKNQIEKLIWTLEKYLSNLLQIPVVFDDL